MAASFARAIYGDDIVDAALAWVVVPGTPVRWLRHLELDAYYRGDGAVGVRIAGKWYPAGHARNLLDATARATKKILLVRLAAVEVVS